MKLMLTIPPYAKFGEVAKSPLVDSVRLNTTHDVNGDLEVILSKIKEQAEGKDVWIDLKGRQLRIKEYSVKIKRDEEIHSIELSHKIELDTPAEVMIDEEYVGNIGQIVDGNKIIIRSSVERGIGLPLPNSGKIGIRPGMSVTILDPSLTIEGYLTDKDKAYIDAAKKNGMHKYMISFVEKESDIIDVLALDPDAELLLKIESKKGLKFALENYPKLKDKYKGKLNIVTARGDLYKELDMPDQIIDACEELIRVEPGAIFASRLFESLVHLDKIPKSQDLFDVYSGMQMGYKSFLLGDDVCKTEASTKAAINLFGKIKDKYDEFSFPRPKEHKILYILAKKGEKGDKDA